MLGSMAIMQRVPRLRKNVSMHLKSYLCQSTTDQMYHKRKKDAVKNIVKNTAIRSHVKNFGKRFGIGSNVIH